MVEDEVRGMEGYHQLVIFVDYTENMLFTILEGMSKPAGTDVEVHSQHAAKEVVPSTEYVVPADVSYCSCVVEVPVNLLMAC